MVTMDATLRAMGNPVPWEEVTLIESFDDRRALLQPRTQNIVGVLQEGVEFCPNEDPPSPNEMLAFLWLVRPDLATGVVNELTDPAVREVIEDFMSRPVRPDSV